MSQKHLQSPLYDVVAGVASVAFVRVPSLRFLLTTGIVACALIAGSSSAALAADRVLVMDGDGVVHARVDHALPPAGNGPADRGMPRPRVPATAAPAASAAARKGRTPARTFRNELKRMATAGQIDEATSTRCRSAFDEAIRSARRVSGFRSAGILNIVKIAHDVAARGALIPSRLPAICLTLERNREWWTTGTLPVANQRIEFSDSELVWQYYPGQGIQLQPLGTFGKANGLWMEKDDARLRALLDEMVPLAAQRGKAKAWEYYFTFGGGSPPWTSALSQATGIQVLARAGQRLGEAAYLEAAKQGLPLFQQAAPVGVQQRTDVGVRFLLYSFSPGLRVLNAFVQSLVGLYDFANITTNVPARRLFNAGDRQARSDVPAADTGAWSLYSLGGAESTLSYHELLRDFLRNLCDRTQTPVYCETAVSFTQDLREPPTMTLLTSRVRARTLAPIRFNLSKISRVGMTIRRGHETVFSTSATLSRGPHYYTWSVPPVRGLYDVTLTATDLAGNAGRATGEVEVLRRTPSAQGVSTQP